MYGFLWRALPGPAWVRVIILAVLALLVVAALFQWVFPQIAPYMPFNNGTVEEAAGRAAPGWATISG